MDIINFAYILFDLIIVISLASAILFYKNIKLPKIVPAIKAIFPVSIFFLAWDILATNRHWFFEYKFTLNKNLINVPFEEILFFVLVPYACLFLLVNVRSKFDLKVNIDTKFAKYLAIGVIGITVIFWKVGLDYSMLVFIVFFIVLILDAYVLKTKLFLRKTYLIYLVFILIFTFIFNNYLTSLPIVTYNPWEKTNINLITSPIEDFIYSLSLITSVNMLYIYFLKKQKSH